MKILLTLLQFFLLVAGVVFAVQWWRYPDSHYEILVGIAAALIPLVEFLKRTLTEEPEERRREKEKAADEREKKREWAELLKTLRDLKTSEKDQEQKAQSASKETAKPDPEREQLMSALNLRDQVEGLIREYAEANNVDSTGTPESVLERVPMDKPFADGIRTFLEVTGDLAHQSWPMIRWASEGGRTSVGSLQMLIENAKKRPPA